MKEAEGKKSSKLGRKTHEVELQERLGEGYADILQNLRDRLIVVMLDGDMFITEAASKIGVRYQLLSRFIGNQADFFKSSNLQSSRGKRYKSPSNSISYRDYLSILRFVKARDHIDS